MKKLLFIVNALLFCCSSMLTAQTLEILGVYTDNYPTIRVRYRLYDSQGEEVRDAINTEDINLKDLVDGDYEVREVSDAYCPAEEKAHSAILVLDFSGSMDSPISDNDSRIKYDEAIKAAKNWVNNFDTEISEVAILGFTCISNIISEFTNDRQLLLDRLDNLPFQPAGGTNYNAAFIANYDEDRTKSVLHFCQNTVAHFKLVVVFLTDGAHTPKCAMFAEAEAPPYNKTFMIGPVVKQLQSSETYTFVVELGSELELDPDDPDPSIAEALANLKTLAGVEGNSDDNLYDQERIDALGGMESVFSDIYEKAAQIGTPAPCYFEFITDSDSGQVTVTITTGEGLVTGEFVYKYEDISVDDDRGGASQNSEAGIIRATPNPATDRFELQYSADQAGQTEIWISDLLGNKIQLLYSGQAEPGRHSLQANLSRVSSGMYYIVMQSPTHSYARQLRVIK